MKTIVPAQNEDALGLLRRCGGYYRCPKDEAGKRTGPLVGYAARYDGTHQYVGDEYVNFAKAEMHGPVLWEFARRIHGRLGEYVGRTIDASRDPCVGFCGAPEGGKALAVALATCKGFQYIFPEKRVFAPKTRFSREMSEMFFNRHQPSPGFEYWIVEDVCNNFSTTREIADLIKRSGASVAGVLCFLNRSTMSNQEIKSQLGLPVVSIVRKRIPEYEQGDPYVAEDILAGNVVWKPKNEWARLALAEMAHQ